MQCQALASTILLSIASFSPFRLVDPRYIDRHDCLIVVGSPSALMGHNASLKGDAPKVFSMAGPERRWPWADAKMDGDTVVVSSPSVHDPRYVRYAWQSNPVATLYDVAGLPAVPFRTDHWER
jgi:hypothetical protein